MIDQFRNLNDNFRCGIWHERTLFRYFFFRLSSIPKISFSDIHLLNIVVLVLTQSEMCWELYPRRSWFQFILESSIPSHRCSKNAFVCGSWSSHQFNVLGKSFHSSRSVLISISSFLVFDANLEYLLKPSFLNSTPQFNHGEIANDRIQFCILLQITVLLPALIVGTRTQKSSRAHFNLFEW